MTGPADLFQTLGGDVLLGERREDWVRLGAPLHGRPSKGEIGPGDITAAEVIEYVESWLVEGRATVEVSPASLHSPAGKSDHESFLPIDPDYKPILAEVGCRSLANPDDQYDSRLRVGARFFCKPV